MRRRERRRCGWGEVRRQRQKLLEMASKAQFEEADFQGEGFLDIAAQTTLKLLENSKVLQCVGWGDPLRDTFGSGHLRKVKKVLDGRLRLIFDR